MKRKTATTLILGITAFGGLTVGLPAAHATLSECPTGQACGWKDADYGELLVNREATSAVIVKQLGANDEISAIADKGTKDIAWYTDAGLEGQKYCENSGTNHSYVGDTWNDKFSSLIVYSNATSCP